MAVGREVGIAGLATAVAAPDGWPPTSVVAISRAARRASESRAGRDGRVETASRKECMSGDPRRTVGGSPEPEQTPHDQDDTSGHGSQKRHDHTPVIGTRFAEPPR